MKMPVKNCQHLLTILKFRIGLRQFLDLDLILGIILNVAKIVLESGLRTINKLIKNYS